MCGAPKWEGEQSRLEIQYDEVDDTFRTTQPVTVPDSRQDSPLASDEAALGVGANTLVDCTATTGQQYCYEGRDPFARFRETTEEIARLQSNLCEGRHSSHRIRRLYRKRTRRRNHAQGALVRDLLERLHDEGVATVYVGDLTDALSAHWLAEVNEKTQQFWAYRSFISRLATTAEEYGITVEVRSEADTTRTCPACGERERTERSGDVFRCSCGYEGHADLGASRTFLERQAGELAVGSMARPVSSEITDFRDIENAPRFRVRLTWDDHEWSESPRSPERARPSEERTNQSTGDGKLASVGTA